MIFIIFDSNFLLLPAQVKINLYEELERLFLGNFQILVFSAIFHELERKISSLSVQNKLHREYQLSKALLKSHPHEIIEKERPGNQDVDDFLIDEAIRLQKEKKQVYIATKDKQLRIKCENRNIATIFHRNGNKLEIR